MSRMRAVLCLAMVLFVALPAGAQFKAGIQGTIKDTSGAVIPGAAITVTSRETNKTYTTISGGRGFYRVDGLAPGQYTVSVEMPGFRKGVVENTFQAFSRAMSCGMDFIELDVQLSADQEAFVLHDETLDRTMNVAGRLANLASVQIDQINATRGNTGIPCLADVIDRLLRSTNQPLLKTWIFLDIPPNYPD